ncbi:Cdc7p-Dbf4p kinase complex regulatory subunit [Savitreella phatthalungensis]
MASRQVLTKKSTNIPVPSQPIQPGKENIRKRLFSNREDVRRDAQLEEALQLEPKRLKTFNDLTTARTARQQQATLQQSTQAQSVERTAQNDEAQQKAASKEASARASHEQLIAQWCEQYRKALPTMRLYFDAVTEEEAYKYRRRVEGLRGQVSPFFDRTVTHVITTRDVPTMPDVANASDMQDILVKAQIFKMRIWPLRKLRDILKSIFAQQHPAQYKAQTLSTTLWRDRHLGQNEVIPFQGPYILVRDMSEQFRPIMHREWAPVRDAREGDWPQWRMTRPGRCPFVRDIVAEARESTPVATRVPFLERSMSMNNGGTAYASGMHSITSAIQSNIRSATHHLSGSVVGNNNNSAMLANLQKKAVTSKTRTMIPPATTATGSTTKPTLTAAAQKQQQEIAAASGLTNSIDPTDSKRIKVVDNREGYCENCRAKFTDFQQHIKTPQHRQYANTTENFRELDLLLESLERMPRLDGH